MRGIERNEFGYPIFEPLWPERNRRGVHEFLERIACQARHGVSIPEEAPADWEWQWIDLGGEG